MVLKETVLRLSEAESLRVTTMIPDSNEGSRRPRKRQAKQAGSQSDSGQTRQQVPVPTARPRTKTPLLGKRKVWGTMNHASAATVSRALIQLSSLSPEDIKVKRKFRNGAKASWWHVISGEENTLKILENEWEGVKMQLGWNILPCFAFSESDVPSATPLTPSSNQPLLLTPSLSVAAEPPDSSPSQVPTRVEPYLSCRRQVPPRVSLTSLSESPRVSLASHVPVPVVIPRPTSCDQNLVESADS